LHSVIFAQTSAQDSHPDRIVQESQSFIAYLISWLKGLVS
jgi:hypothetical protein